MHLKTMPQLPSSIKSICSVKSSSSPWLFYFIATVLLWISTISVSSDTMILRSICVMSCCIRHISNRLVLMGFYFEQLNRLWFCSCWQLQHRQREAKQTEQALWHWSLTLQAKVKLASSLQMHSRNGAHRIWRVLSLLSECAAGVVRVEDVGQRAAEKARTCSQSRTGLQRPAAEGGCLVHPHICCSHEWSHNRPYATHTTTSRLLCVSWDFFFFKDRKSQRFASACILQRSQRLQRVVERCAARWKQRVLCKPGREHEVRGQPPKKSVTFCLSSVSSCEQEAEDGLLWVCTSSLQHMASYLNASLNFKFWTIIWLHKLKHCIKTHWCSAEITDEIFFFLLLFLEPDSNQASPASKQLQTPLSPVVFHRTNTCCHSASILIRFWFLLHIRAASCPLCHPLNLSCPTRSFLRTPTTKTSFYLLLLSWLLGHRIK